MWVKLYIKRTDMITDEYGNTMSYVVTPESISITDLYQVASPYKTVLKNSYEQYKNSESYRDSKLTEEQYILATHHTRAFQYESLNEQRQAVEMWRDIALGLGVILLTIFCPPAGAVASAELYLAAVGKDWGTGRELGATER